MQNSTIEPGRPEMLLERAQRAAYYAAMYLRDHPGYPEAQEGYRSAIAHVQAVIAQIQQTNNLQ